MRQVPKILPMGISYNVEFPMISQETWCEHAREALSKVYKPDEVETIVEWFLYMKGADEISLVGHDRVSHHVEFAWGDDKKGYTSVYASMMSRMWIYAPYILEEAIERGELE